MISLGNEKGLFGPTMLIVIVASVATLARCFGRIPVCPIVTLTLGRNAKPVPPHGGLARPFKLLVSQGLGENIREVILGGHGSHLDLTLD